MSWGALIGTSPHSRTLQDKTFGIKNKKGRKQQTYIKQVTNQVKYGGGQSIAKASQVNQIGYSMVT